MKKSIHFIMAIFSAVILIMLIYLWWQYITISNMNLDNKFTVRDIQIDSNNLFDIGVADYNNDGLYDIFTSNHHSQQSVLKGIGQLQFSEVFSELGLDQQLEFPGIEICNPAPEISSTGLFIFFQTKEINLVWIPDDENKTINGEFILPSAIKIKDNSGFIIDIHNEFRAKGIEKNKVLFNALKEANITFSVEFVEIPILFITNNTIPVEKIHIGSSFVNPARNSFKTFLNDRHGMAWADINGDNAKDLFITRGGLRNKLREFSEHFTELYTDELFVQEAAGFNNIIQASNIFKGNCPGYNVEWIDYDQDNLLDLFIVCHHDNPNILYKNLGNGKFKNVSDKLGLSQISKRTDTPLLWTDFDGDTDFDLLLTSDNGIELYINHIDSFQYSETFRVSEVTKISPNDFDMDGDLDLFLASWAGNNTLLIKTETGFLKKTASEVGLPESCLDANWVDYDNDGSCELMLIPHGIYKQSKDGRFIKTSILEFDQPKFIKRARSTWCDLDNDGDSDLLMAIYYEDPIWIYIINKIFGNYIPDFLKGKGNYDIWDVKIYENNLNDEPKQHWIQLKLKNHNSNLEAIGSILKLKYAGKEIYAQTGQFEGSMTSQGHYRLYFGLGDHSGTVQIELIWPDGYRQMEVISEIDRVVEIIKN